MLTLVFQSLAIGGSAFSALIVWQLALALIGKNRMRNLELIPNILLTRHPVVFINAPRSFLRLNGDFMELPTFLSQHGFRVEEVELQGSLSEVEKQLQMLLNLLSLQPRQTTQGVLSNELNAQSAHLIFSPRLSNLAVALAQLSPSKTAFVSSITLMGEYKRRHHLTPLKRPITEVPLGRPTLGHSISTILKANHHQGDHFKAEMIALNHIVSLAESDLR